MNYLKLIVIIFIYLLFIKNSFSQPQTEWVQRYNSPGNYDDYVWDMAIDKSGNVYLTGYISVTSTNQDFVTIKYNTGGIQQWVRYYDSPNHGEDKAGFIAVDDSGNVFVSGTSTNDYLTIKYNSQGDSLWVRRYQDGLNANAMALDKEGNVYITGNTIGDDILTIKYDNDGNLKWTRYFNGKGDGYDDPHSIGIDNNSNVYINGFSFGSSGSVTLKYDLNGNEKWVRYYFANWYYLNIDSLNNIFCGGETLGQGFDYCVLKYDSLGNVIWVRTYDNGNISNNNDYSREMCVDKYGNVTLTGVNTTNSLDYDIATVKYDTSGDTIWVKKYIGPGLSNDESKGVVCDKSGNVYVGGTTSDASSTIKFLTIKYSPMGNQQWVTKYNNNPSTSHNIRKIKTDSSGNIYVTGLAIGNGNNQDLLTIKYSNLTSFNNNIKSIPDKFILNQNFPNPFNSTTKITYSIKQNSFVEIKLYNILGREVKTLLKSTQDIGIYNLTFNAEDLESGIYFYSLIINDLVIETKKLILLK